MTPVFADTFYWYGLANRRDQWHALVLQARAKLGQRQIVTTEEVLVEFFGAMSSDGYLRAAAQRLVQAVIEDPRITVLSQSSETFAAGIRLYGDRPDKTYSLVDCISMNACRTRGLTEVLTNDSHFEQEGFTILIRR